MTARARLITSPQFLLGALCLIGLPRFAAAQITDPFNTLNPAWVVNRYAPAGFQVVSFQGDNRLSITIDPSGSAANRPFTSSSSFYNIQGEERAGNVTGRWSLSAQVYVASSFNTTTGTLMDIDLWSHTGTTPGGGDYAIFGFTNSSPTDFLNPAAADRAFHFEAYDGNTGHWFNLGVPSGFAFDAWHQLTTVSTGTAFNYYIDGQLYLTNPTSAGYDLLSVMIQGYNFGATAGSYSVLWDNVTTTPIPEPAGSAVVGALAVSVLVVRRRRGNAARSST